MADLEPIGNSLQAKNTQSQSEMKTKKDPNKKCHLCGENYAMQWITFLERYGFPQKSCDCVDHEEQRRIEEEEKRRRDARIKQAIDILIKSAGKRFEEAELQDFQKATRLHKMAHKYLDNLSENIKNGDGLLIYGEPGNGKTHLLVALGKEIIRRGYRVKFRSVPNLLDQIRNSYNKESGDSEEDIFKQIKEAEVLLLDDLGAEKWTEWVEAKLYQIIDYRYRNCLPILFTSNLDEPQIQEITGRRTYDRLLEMCLLIENKMPSFREKRAEQRAKEG